jgi:hypothetical protein
MINRPSTGTAAPASAVSLHAAEEATALPERFVRDCIMRRRTVITGVAAAFLEVFSIRTWGTTRKQAVVVRSLHQCSAEAGEQRRELRIGDPIYAGDTVDVSAGAKLKLRMDDGSVISLASGSRLTIHTFGIDTGDQKLRLTLTSWKAMVEVSFARFSSCFIPSSGFPEEMIIDDANALEVRRSSLANYICD